MVLDDTIDGFDYAHPHIFRLRTLLRGDVCSDRMRLFLAAPAGAQQEREPVFGTGDRRCRSRFLRSTSGGLAKVIESTFAKYGLPNGYILGQEGSGAFIAGLTYGEGALYTKNAGQHPVFWQGPSLGIDYGGQGTRAMMLVYDLPSVNSLYARFGGVSGSAFVVAGVGMTVLRSNSVILVPIRTGLGARLASMWAI